MAFNLKENLRRWGVLVLAFSLTACITAPGMRMDTADTADHAENGADAAALQTITPELVRQEKALERQRSGPDITPLIAAPTPYLIGNGDILSIIVWDHPELAAPAMAGAAQATAAGVEGGSSPGFVVDQNGMVQFPYVGMLKLSGLSEAQAHDLLTARLGQYFRKPNLTLRVQAYRSQRVYLSGEVKTPGIQTINDIPMNLEEALNRAGGVLSSGDASQIEVTRGDMNYRVNLPLLVSKGMNPANLMLASGDEIRVFAREDSKVFVLGEVTRPLTLPMRDGHMTLGEALGEAGGLNPMTSDARQVYVVRGAVGDAGQPQVFHLDARSPAAFALANNFQLKAKDVVYVDAAPLAVWSRVVSLIIPSAQSVTSAVQAGK